MEKVWEWKCRRKSNILFSSSCSLSLLLSPSSRLPHQPVSSSHFPTYRYLILKAAHISFLFLSHYVDRAEWGILYGWEEKDEKWTFTLLSLSKNTKLHYTIEREKRESQVKSSRVKRQTQMLNPPSNMIHDRKWYYVICMPYPTKPLLCCWLIIFHYFQPYGKTTFHIYKSVATADLQINVLLGN